MPNLWPSFYPTNTDPPAPAEQSGTHLGGQEAPCRGGRGGNAEAPGGASDSLPWVGFSCLGFHAMSSTPRGAQAPRHRECLLPSVARTPSVAQVTPAKKITFLKQGDPRFSGVRLAVHQRTFRSFGTLMDELSRRVPLPFGVRSVTTPRGLHGLSALEQLEDGGCYLCSDRKLPATSRGPGQPQGRRPSARRSPDVEEQCGAPETSPSRKNPKAPRRILLVKNGDPRLQRTVVVSHRDTRSLSAFLDKASGLLHFPVKQLYTPGGVKVGCRGVAWSKEVSGRRSEY